jgi:hypothetical protein
MTELRYSSKSLNADILRAIIGFVLCICPVILIVAEPLINLILLSSSLLFLIFGIRTWLRRRVRIYCKETEITIKGPISRSLEWDELSSLKLSYFSTRRNKKDGWMQLKLEGKSKKLTIESNLEKFEEICSRAYQAASNNKIAITKTSERNFAELGILKSKNRQSKNVTL